MSEEVITLHVPRSDDGRTEFARLADILDHLATLYGWHPDVYAHLTVLVNNAREIDRVYPAGILESITLEEAREHVANHPRGCEFGRGCDVCVAAGKFKS